VLHSQTKNDDYLGAVNREVAEIFPVLSGSNLLPTPSVWDVYHCLRSACGNPQSHTCHTAPPVMKYADITITTNKHFSKIEKKHFRPTLQ